nr:MAG TPA: hypothetical protein [Caudoviricetes sp.]
MFNTCVIFILLFLIFLFLITLSLDFVICQLFLYESCSLN